MTALPCPAARRASPFALLLLAVGCAGPGTTEPTYEGCATDENWRTMDDYETTGRVKSEPASAPVWLEPSAGAALPAGGAIRLRWQPTPQNPGRDNGDATCPQFQQLVVLPASLEPAHLPAVSGTLYDLHVQQGGETLYRVMTTRQLTDLPADLVRTLAGKSVSVALYSARLLRNDVAEGPYAAPALGFQVTQ